MTTATDITTRVHLAEALHAAGGPFLNTDAKTLADAVLAFFASQPSARLVNGELVLPEFAPYNPDGEDCDACSEGQDLCRYHLGYTDGAADARKGLA